MESEVQYGVKFNLETHANALVARLNRSGRNLLTDHGFVAFRKAGDKLVNSSWGACLPNYIQWHPNVLVRAVRVSPILECLGLL